MDRQINIAGKNIFYRVYGSGKLVMLVHGFGETGDVWKNQASLNPSKGGTLAPKQNQIAKNSLLEEKFRLSESSKVLRQSAEGFRGADKFMFIVPDLPGSGRSEMIDDMSMEGMAEVLKIILDIESEPPQTSRHSGGTGSPKEGLRNTQAQPIEDSLLEEKFRLSESEVLRQSAEGFRGARGAMIGHSMGGYITLAFAEKYEGLIGSFGLFSSTAFADSEEKKIARRKGIDFIKEHGAFEFLKTATPNLFSQRSRDDSPELVSQFLQSLNNFSPGSLVSYYESMIKRPDRTAILKNTKLPVLFIMGEHDNAIPLQDGLKQCHLPEKSYFHVLHQSGHMGMLEEIEKSNRLLDQFLSET